MKFRAPMTNFSKLGENAREIYCAENDRRERQYGNKSYTVCVSPQGGYLPNTVTAHETLSDAWAFIFDQGAMFDLEIEIDHSYQAHDDMVVYEIFPRKESYDELVKLIGDN